MALYKAVTFEGGSLTGPQGFDSTSGTLALETANPILGDYSLRVPSNGSGNQGWVSFSSNQDQVAAAYYLRIDGEVSTATTSGFANQFGSYFFSADITSSRTIRANGVGGPESNPLDLGVVYRVDIIYRNTTPTGTARQYIAVTNTETNVTQVVFDDASAVTGAPRRFQIGRNANVIFDEIHVRDDDTLPTLPPLPGIVEPTDITATTILEPVATVAIQQEHRIRAVTMLELTTALEMETPTEIAAKTILELVADLAIDTTSAAIISAETLLELVAEAGIQQEHRIRAETLLELVADLSLEADDAANISAETLLELVATAEVATAHHVRAETLLELVATAEIAQEHNIRAVTLLELVVHEGYTGPGTGIVVPGQRFTPNSLREGDTFRVVLPWAGLSGMTGLAHVNSRTLRDDRHEQDLNLHISPLDQPNVPALAGGVRPVATAAQTDYARRLARNEREQDRIERDRR